MEESCLPVTDPIPSTLSLLYTFSQKFMCVVHDQSIHIYKLTENKWYCTSCTGNCPEREVVIEYQKTHDFPTQNHEYHPMRFATITTNAIPHTFSEDMKAIYRTQITQGLDLPELLRSSAQECQNGFRLQLAGPVGMSSKGIFIYTESDVISLPHHQGKPHLFLENYDYCLPLNIISEFIFFSMQTNM